MQKRLMIVVGLLFAVVFSASQVSAQIGQGSASVVKAKGYISQDGVAAGKKFKLAVELEIAEGYHINGHIPSEDYLVATNLKLEPVAGLKFSEPKYQKPKLQKFDFSEKELAVLEGKSFIIVEGEAENNLKPGDATLRATVTVQSCNNNLCLQPADLKLEIPVKLVAASQIAKEINAEVFAQAATQQVDDGSVVASATATKLTQFGGAENKNEIAANLEKYGLLPTLFVIFWAGVLLNLTPCVYPIIPITISFFANQGGAQKPSLKRTFAMSSLYVLGMALTYSVLGVIASLTGGLFGALLQSPIVLIGIALLMVALSLSMFGVYEFKLPDSLNRLANSGQQSKSSLFSALMMGLTMGIVAAPCIGPFVVALLAFVSSKGDPFFGFLLFFVLALGLGFPFIFLGAFSGSLKALPRSGVWMVTVRKVFGLVLIGMALYFLNPLMGKWASYVFVAFFAISALYLLFVEAGKARPVQFAWVLRALGVAAIGLAVWFAIPVKVGESIKWQPYSEQALLDAQKQGKGVIIDTFADWCIPCKELDQLTFTDVNVKSEAEKFITLKLDLTTADEASEAGRAKNKFAIRGVPTVLFLDARGAEIPNLRLEGFEKPDKFLARMKQLGSAPANTEVAKNTTTEMKPVSDAAPNGASGESAGEPAPTLSLNVLDGGKVDLASLKGKVVLVDFWATWCVPCLSQIPIFNDFSTNYKSQGFEMLGISLDEEGAEIVKPFVKKQKMNYTIAVGDAKVAEAFKLSSETPLPVAFLIDKQGRIRYTHKGTSPNVRAEFEAQIKQLLSE
ncbi:MAG: cytochrome c biogenesis protein CcdA [Acidobacteriota bacterium]